MSNTAPAQETRERVAKLATWLIEEPLTDVASIRKGPYLDKVFSVSGESHHRRLYIDKEGVDLYFSALNALENDAVCEHITRREVDRELATLAYDLLADQERMKGSHAFQERIRLFYSTIARALVTYEVTFNVEHVKLPTTPITIGNVVFQEFSRELARSYQDVASSIRRGIDAFIDQPVGIVRVEAGSRQKAIERAGGNFDHALNILRVCIGSFRPAAIHDVELLQRRGKHWIIREISSEIGNIGHGWEMGFRPIGRDVLGTIEMETRLFREQIEPLYDGSIQGRLRDTLLRSLEWIGVSITRQSYDHKVIDLCIALEAALTTKGDPRKGEAIAVRAILLPMALGKGFPSPQELYHLYNVRSRIVHGAALRECGERDYRILQSQAASVILNIIELTRREAVITRSSYLIKFLESREQLEKAIRWLEQQPGQDAADLAEYARERLAALPEGTGRQCPPSSSES